MTPQGEHLDETIDRVAAALTMVPADPALAERIAQRLQTESAAPALAWGQLAFGAVALTAAVLIAIALDRDPEITSLAPIRVAQQPAPLVTPVEPKARAPQPRIASQIAATPRQARRIAGTHQAFIANGDAPKLDTLSAPKLLEVDSLTNDPLTISPVDVAPLDLATLTISDVGRDTPKE